MGASRRLVSLALWGLCALGCSSDEPGQPDAAPPRPDAMPGVVTLTPGAADRFLIGGRILTPGGPLTGEVLVEGNLITCVAASCSASPGAAGATVVRTSGIVLPGLIDAHNHGLFNIFDEADWPAPATLYTNHNAWTTETRYQQVLSAKQALTSGAGDVTCEMDKYAEIKALVAGTTSFLLAPGINRNCFASLARTIDASKNGLPADLMQTAISVPATDADAKKVCDNFASGATTAYVVHVAEGVDAAARAEFTTLAGLSGGCLLSPHTTIVHGTALQAADFAQMAGAGMRLVWSPKSNVFLYGSTARIDLALAAGVSTIALAPDWSMGGSVNLLDELRVADAYQRAHFAGAITARRLFEMVTIDAARALSVDAYIGSIEVGKRADLALLDGDPADPYQAVLGARPTTIELVMVDGVVLYGDAPLVAAGPAAPGCELVAVCGAPKFLCVAQTVTTDKLNQTYADILTALTSALATYDGASGVPALSPIAPVSTCQ